MDGTWVLGNICLYTGSPKGHTMKDRALTASQTRKR